MLTVTWTNPPRPAARVSPRWCSKARCAAHNTPSIRAGRVQKKMAQDYAAPLCLTVVEAAGDDLKRAFQHRVHQTVLTINPPRPKFRQISLEWLRLADAFEGIRFAGVNQLIDLLGQQRIGFLPVLIVFPAIVRK